MRQIKFRAWDNQKKKMILDVGVFDNMAVLEPQYVYDSPERQIVELKGSILMQFTGLLDKNGKEIYEGDIVSTSFWYHGSEKTEFIEKPLIGQVQYWGECHGSYNLLDKTGGSIPIEWACHKNDGWKIYGEIIGNIYENAELLENK